MQPNPTDANSADANSENLVPPEVKLTAPFIAEPTEPTQEKQAEEAAPASNPDWLVVARNLRVNKDWEKLLQRAPANASRCYRDLRTAPIQRQQGRVFPLKGDKYKGAWEYEVTKGDRVFYIPNEEKRKVIVYYAGEHPKKAPEPPL